MWPLICIKSLLFILLELEYRLPNTTLNFSEDFEFPNGVGIIEKSLPRGGILKKGWLPNK